MSLAAMKTTKLQDADCANKDVYEMILGAYKRPYTLTYIWTSPR